MFSEMSYHAWRFMAFKPNDQSYGHIHAIVSSNDWQNGWVSIVLIHLWWKRQIPADSARSGSNLNCSCLIVCYLFFPKIISRYISIYLIRETSKVFSKIQPLVRNGQARRFDRIFKRHKKFKKIKKLENLRIVSLYVTKFPGKIIIL